MTDVLVHPSHASGAAVRLVQLATLLKRSIRRAIMADGTRRALNDLPDNILSDIGVTRSEIPFVADALASSDAEANREAPDRRDHTAPDNGPAARFLPRLFVCIALAVMMNAASSVMPSCAALAQDAHVKRGKYLVTVAGCNDCHTPGYFFGKPDMARFLGGSEVGFEIPGRGVFHGPNLTPDRDTGLGTWSTEEIVTAITKGERPDGRILAPIMPWHAFANLTGQDAHAIAAFLRSLSPVKNKVPGPFGPSEKPTSFIMKIVPPDAAAPGDAALK